MAKEINPLECECGHVAGAPATLRIHKATHDTTVPEITDKELDKAIDTLTAPEKKVRKPRKAK